MATKETGIKRTEDGGVFFEAWGADLKKPESAHFARHMDGAKFYKNIFECVKCGAVMTQECERSAEDAAYWQ
jgi:hypothetical protein